MTPLEAATIYTDLVKLHNEIPEDEGVSRDAVGAVRTRYHQQLMDVFREYGIEFSDRFEAMRIAFEMVESGLDPSTPSVVEIPAPEFAHWPPKLGMCQRCARCVVMLQS